MNNFLIAISRLVLGWCFSAVISTPFLSMGSVSAQGLNFNIKTTEIRVEGSQRIEPETVRSYIKIR